MSHTVIIGNGIAGITAARHIRKKSSNTITVISGESDYFFSRTALMYIYMGHMKFEHTKPYEDWFWKKNKIELVRDWVQSVDFANKQLKLNKSILNYDQLIIATGSKPNKFGWPGQDLSGVQGLYHLQDVELMEANTKNVKHAVIVGGGLIGIEMAEMLHARGIHVTYLVRETNFWGVVLPQNEAKMINRHILEHGIDLRLETELKAINGHANGWVSSIVTNKDETIECQFVGLTVGVSPNLEFLVNSGLKIDKGIVVNQYLETNQPDVFAIGDCAQLNHPPVGRRTIEAVWYVGRMMGETVAKTLTGNKTAYNPGNWFNSAKFFDIEYQTYGMVPAELPSTHNSFYWEANDGKKCVNLIYDKNDWSITGVNTFGIRMRHEVWDQWLTQKISLHEVITNLKKSIFDPEFFKPYDTAIQAQFNEHFPNWKVQVRPLNFLEKIFS